MAARKRRTKPPRPKASRTIRSSSVKQGRIGSKVFEPRTKSVPAKLTSSVVSKKDIVLGMLREADGTSIAAIMTATGWQEHSVRGFFAAIVKKKLKLNLVSQKVGGGRVYRIEKTDPTV